MRQLGVVDAAQLRTAGFDRASIKRWLRAGHLRRLHRGVFQVAAVGAAPRAAEMAALLACGKDRSVISHRSAAQLWGLTVDWSAAQVEVTVAGRNPGSKPGIKIHRVPVLDRRDVRKVDGVPATAPARTLLDISAVMTFDDLEIAYAEGPRAPARSPRRSLGAAGSPSRSPRGEDAAPASGLRAGSRAQSLAGGAHVSRAGTRGGTAFAEGEHPGRQFRGRLHLARTTFDRRSRRLCLPRRQIRLRTRP
jgi:hypothetical protein